MTTISDSDRAEAQAMFEAFNSHAALAPLRNGSVRRWLAVRDHVLAAHECPTVPVWRPVIDGEDLTGYEVRSRFREVDMWHAWGVAHHRDGDGDWRTEAGQALTYTPAAWTYETTAPLPEPEPDPRVDLLEGVSLREGVVLTRPDAAMLLSIADAAERPKAGA